MLRRSLKDVSDASSAPHSRVLVDISAALWERAGIPQVARQLTSILSSAPDIATSSLILSIHDSSDAGRFRGKAGAPNSLIEDAEFLADALGQQQKRRTGLLASFRKSLKKLVSTQYPIIPIKKGPYDDVIWENYFAPGLGAHRRDLLPLVTFYRSPLTRREVSWRLRKRLPCARLDTTGFDFVIFQNPSPIRVSPGTVKIIRCHDLVPLLRFDTQPIERHVIRDFHNSLSLCVKDSCFACVSESTRKELISFYPEAAEKAFVIPNSIIFSPSLSAVRSLTQAAPGDIYFLAVGTIEPRKNYCRLIDAFRAWRRSQPNAQQSQNSQHLQRLVLVGNLGWRNEKELREIKLAVKEGWLTWHKEVSPDQLAALYRSAHAFICSSMHEGFGIPPLEAAALGVPPLLSDLPVFRAHFGDSAEYFDPYDPSSITRALTRFTPERRHQLQADAGQKARQFEPARELARWQELFARLCKQNAHA